MVDDPRARRLLRELVKGSPEAWTDFVGRTLGAVQAAIRQTFARYSVKANDADVEDLTASLYMTLIQNNYRILRRLGPPYDLKAFMVVAAKRRAIDALRLRGHQPKSLESMNQGDPATPPDGEPPAVSPQAIQAALRTLPPRDAMLVRLVYVHNKSYREAASLTGIPMNSVGPTLVRSLEKIRRVLLAKKAR